MCIHVYEYIYIPKYKTHIHIPKHNQLSLYNTTHMYVFTADHLVLGASLCALPGEAPPSIPWLPVALSLAEAPWPFLPDSACLMWLPLLSSCAGRHVGECSM